MIKREIVKKLLQQPGEYAKNISLFNQSLISVINLFIPNSVSHLKFNLYKASEQYYENGGDTNAAC